MSLNVNTTELNELLEKEGITIVDFWAPWCGPCKMYGPIIEKFAENNPELNIAKVNVDENQDKALEYGVRSIPTTVFFKDGKEVHKQAGVITADKLTKLVTDLS